MALVDTYIPHCAISSCSNWIRGMEEEEDLNGELLGLFRVGVVSELRDQISHKHGATDGQTSNRPRTLVLRGNGHDMLKRED